MVTAGKSAFWRGVIGNKLKSILASVGTDLLFWTGVCAAVAILMIPQISSIFLQVEFEWETLWGAGDRAQTLQGLLQFLGFIAYLDSVALLALASILYVVPPSWFSQQSLGLTPKTFQNLWPAVISMIVVTILGLLLLLAMGVDREGLVLSAFLLAVMGLALILVGRWVDQACSWLVKLNDKLSVERRYKAAAALGLIAVLLWAVIRPDSGWLYCLSGSAFHGMAALFLLVGAWLVVTNWYRERPDAQPLLQASGRLVGWLVLACAGGELVWILAGGQWTQSVFSYRLYTIWAVLELCALFILVGSFLDTWDDRTRYPVRVTAILGLLAILVVTKATAPEQLPRATSPGTAVAGVRDEHGSVEPWYAAFEQRIKSIPEGEPVLLVAASGGGSRAAIFAGLAMEALARTPCGKRAGDNWAKHVVLISSVSGGSLATAQFAHRQGGEFPEQRPALLNSVKSELLTRMERVAKASHVRYQQLHTSDADRAAIDVRRGSSPGTRRSRSASGWSAVIRIPWTPSGPSNRG